MWWLHPEPGTASAMVAFLPPAALKHENTDGATRRAELEPWGKQALGRENKMSQTLNGL